MSGRVYAECRCASDEPYYQELSKYWKKTIREERLRIGRLRGKAIKKDRIDRAMKQFKENARCGYGFVPKKHKHMVRGDKVGSKSRAKIELANLLAALRGED